MEKRGLTSGFKRLKHTLVAATALGASILTSACSTNSAQVCKSPTDWVRENVKSTCGKKPDPDCERGVRWMEDSAVNICNENNPDNIEN